MVSCNATLEDAHVHEKDLSIGITFHHLGLILSAVTGLIALSIAFYLIIQHALHYSKPWEQKHIIRILFMIPIYAVVSFLSYYNYRYAIYYEVLRDCYEAFAIASFFTLLCHYLAPNLHEQKEYFRRQRNIKNWILPVSWIQRCTGGTESGPFRIPRSGLTWFNILWVCVFQYCFIRVLFTIVSVLAEVGGRYCEDSLNPAFAHVWVMVFEGVSVTIAMYGLIQFYIQLKPDIAEHKPFFKLLCIKLVIFFCFWQTIILSFLTSGGAIEPGPHLSWPDIRVGLPSMLVCFEMAIFAIMHIYAFPWREPYAVEEPEAGKRYSANSAYMHSHPYPPPGPGYPPPPFYQGGRFGWRAYLDAFNPWDMIKACGRGFRWLFVGVRHRHADPSYHDSFAYDMASNNNHTASKAHDQPYPYPYPPASGSEPVSTAYPQQTDPEALSMPPMPPMHPAPSQRGFYAAPPEQPPPAARPSADMSWRPPPYQLDGAGGAPPAPRDEKRFSFEGGGDEEDRTGLLAHGAPFEQRRSRSAEREVEAGLEGDGDQAGVHPAFRRSRS